MKLQNALLPPPPDANYKNIFRVSVFAFFIIHAAHLLIASDLRHSKWKEVKKGEVNDHIKHEKA